MELTCMRQWEHTDGAEMDANERLTTPVKRTAPANLGDLEAAAGVRLFGWFSIRA